jgi:hypothetical protein
VLTVNVPLHILSVNTYAVSVMLDQTVLKDVLHETGLSQQEKLLLCMGTAPLQARSVAEIRALAVGAGVREAKGWNVSRTLGRLAGVVRTEKGWELNADGRARVSRLIGSPTPAAVSSLRDHLHVLTSPIVKTFVEEAVGCIESRHYRAAVVLSWVGAVAVLYDAVVSKALSAFNTEARRRDARWKDAKTADELARMKEHDFLQVLEAISMIGKSVKAELEGCLKLRNGCGHPNSLSVAEHRVNAHVETLMLNVFKQF